MNPGEIILYQTEDGESRIDVQLVDETVWLSAGQIADLFQRDKSTISRHIQNVFEEGELKRDSVVAVFATTAADGKTYSVEHFNLDVIISVGYRVKSHRGTQFRIWATQQIRDYLVKGFVLNDEKFKQGGSSNYFDLLLERIRDIRSSEKEFWRKVLDIYSTSIDYDPAAEASQRFFATIQNKMHWASHGQTAAEVIHARSDASAPQMGLKTWPAGQLAPRRADVAIAKNYLTTEELENLNLIVSLYLDFATLKARSRKAMYMADWIAKLDQFLQISDREILTHAGSISAETARLKAEGDYEKFRRTLDAQPSIVDQHFQQAISKAKKIEDAKKPGRKKGEAP
jgi:hypothetical protein